MLDGLAEILGVTADSLRETGRALRTDVGEADDAVFARTARPSPEWQLEHAEEALLRGRSAEREAEWDEVDQLFRGDRE